MLVHTEDISIHRTTRRHIDTHLFASAKKIVLGTQYHLSVVLCGDTRAKKLNVMYRNKTYTPNVLSFPVSETSGEIFLNVAQVIREAGKYGHTTQEHLHYLLIHGMLHLKGHLHGSTMEGAECRTMKKIFPQYVCR
jgi:rRNA maturation RNase YbeY